MSNNKDLSKIIAQPATLKDKQIAQIENDLQREKDARKEERFYWIFAIILTVDIFVFPNSSSIIGIFSLTIIELILLLGLAICLGLENISVILSNIIAKYLNKNNIS